jgi:5'-nucleotidase
VAAGTAGITLGAVPYELFAHEDFTTISILHTNDIHCHIEPFTGTNERYANKGGLARIAKLAALERQKNPNTLLLDAGDMFQGTPYFNYFKGELMLKVMSEAGYDASTIGNHEFDNGLQGIKDPLPNAEFPIISSNYDFSDTILSGSFPEYKIFKRDGVKIGIYGVGIELENLVGKKNYGATVYNDPVVVAQRMESFLKNDKKCDLVICLSHIGLRYRDNKVSDMVLAAETSFTDLIIGGHTHSYLEKPLEEKNKLGQPVIVNQAWWGGLVVGKVDFVFEKSKRNKKAVYSDLL